MDRSGRAPILDDTTIKALRAFVDETKDANPDGCFVESTRLRLVVEAVDAASPDLRAQVLAKLETEAVRGASFVSTHHIARAFGHMYSTLGHKPGFDAIKAATEDNTRIPLVTLRQRIAV